METKSYYTWRLKPEGHGPCYMIPRADPMEYEFPIDFVFGSKDEAWDFLDEWEIPREESDEWILIKVTETPVDI